MHDGCADIVDQLFLDELLAIINTIENFSDGQGSCGVLADDSKAFLEFGGRGIFQPKKVKRLQILAQPCGFDWCQTMVDVVEKMQIRAKLFAQAREKLRSEIQIAFGGPLIFRGRIFFRGLVMESSTAYPVGAG
jgi:hypothetical protein